MADVSYRLIVFDWDGTLKDSIASIVGCGRAALADVGLETTEERIRGTVGLALDRSIESWVPGIAASDLELVVARYRHHWIERFHAEGQLFAGVEEALVELERAGHLLAVATGKSRAGLERDLARLSFAERRQIPFAATRTADETAAKPSPQMLLELMEELGATPGETLMIGDTTHDLEMAANAGVDALAVLGGAMNREQLTPLALALLDGVHELPHWIDSWWVDSRRI